LEKYRGTGDSRRIGAALAIHRWLNMGRNLAEGGQKQEGERKAGGGAWQRGDPACEQRLFQPDFHSGANRDTQQRRKLFLRSL